METPVADTSREIIRKDAKKGVGIRIALVPLVLAKPTMLICWSMGCFLFAVTIGLPITMIGIGHAPSDSPTIVEFRAGLGVIWRSVRDFAKQVWASTE